MRFFVLGDVSVDLLFFLERIPEPGEEVPSRRALMKPGGAGGTLAAQLASLGHRVFLAGRVGKDPFAELALSRVREVGVDLRHLQEDPEHTTSSVLILVVPGGERAMVSAEGASRYLDPALFKPRFLDQVDAVVLSAYALVGGPSRSYAAEVLEAARRRELPVFADLGAGDAYTAAFAHAILEGLSPVEAGRLANLAGALAATAIGAQGRLVTLEDLKVAAG